jgi:hypothetical protein
MSAALEMIATDLSSDIMVVINEENPKKRDLVCAKLENFLYKIRNNEDIKTFVHRRDEFGKTIILIGLDEHEQKDAIINALSARAEREGMREGIKILTKNFNIDSKKVASELLKIAKEISRI